MNKIVKNFGVIIGLMITVSSFGQTKKEIVRVSEGDTINYMLTKGFQYFFPTFEEGRVYFKSKESTGALLNYNLISNEIHFISKEKQATKEFKEGKEVRLAEKLDMTGVDFVIIENQIFLNTSRGVMRVVANYDTRLLELETVSEVGDTKVGAYGQPLYTGAATAQTSISGRTSGAGIDENVKLTNNVLTEYKIRRDFFLQRDNKIYSASNAKQVGKVFPSIKSDIASFVSENKTDFTNLNDMKKLLQFCLDKTKASK